MIKAAALKDSLFKYVDVRFLLKFVLLFLVLYYFNLSYEAITNPPGLVYSPWLDHYLNYIHLVKLSILHTADLIGHVIGLNSVFIGDYTLQLPNGSAVKMYYECGGFGLSSFWAAFVNAHDFPTKKKVFWIVAGVALIWLINCLRFVMILFVLNRDGTLTKSFDHHTLFNYCCYLIIAIMGSAFYKSYKKHGQVYLQK